MTGDVLRRIREARGVSMAEIRDVSPYKWVLLMRIEQDGLSYHKGATGSHNDRRRRNWRRVIAVIRAVEKRRNNGKV